jgi:hypothetical protein
MKKLEFDECDFCHEEKLVERTYIRPNKYIKPKNPKEYCKLYNEGDYFIIVQACSDCGKPNI